MPQCKSIHITSSHWLIKATGWIQIEPWTTQRKLVISSLFNFVEKSFLWHDKNTPSIEEISKSWAAESSNQDPSPGKNYQGFRLCRLPPVAVLPLMLLGTYSHAKYLHLAQEPFGQRVSPILTRGGSRFLHRRGRQPSRGHQHTIWPNFPKTCMQLSIFRAIGGEYMLEGPLRAAFTPTCEVPLTMQIPSKYSGIKEGTLVVLQWCWQWRIQDFPEVGAPTYDFAKISQKLHEIERIWAPGGRPKFYYVDPPLADSDCHKHHI